MVRDSTVRETFKGTDLKTYLRLKRTALYGHATLHLYRAQLQPWINAASALLPDSVCAEFAGVLSTFPTARPQGSVNGLNPTEKAQAILWHVSKQRGIDTAPRLILARAAAVLSYEPMPTSSPQFRKVQTGRAVYGLLRSDSLQLYGKTYRLKISMQSHRVACALHKTVEPILYWPLKDGLREAIQKAATA